MNSCGCGNPHAGTLWQGLYLSPQPGVSGASQEAPLSQWEVHLCRLRTQLNSFKGNTAAISVRQQELDIFKHIRFNHFDQFIKKTTISLLPKHQLIWTH